MQGWREGRVRGEGESTECLGGVRERGRGEEKWARGREGKCMVTID